MTRKIKPYLQGELDSLCGIHAIINALYALFPDMMDREAQRLFQKLLEEVARKQVDPLRIAWRGMNQALLRHLISYGADLVARDRSVALDVSRPFAKARVGLEALVSRLREHVSEGGVAIICVRGTDLHLTVVDRVTRTKLHLFDSGHLKRIRIEQCGLKPGSRYRIRASETMLLRKAAEQG